jgi:DNA polymerase theta
LTIGLYDCLEGSAQRHIQLGVAKKIKSGARKIVLDKAEEARIVAFSAFKSLGLDVPHFSLPVLPTAIGDHVRQGAATISSGDGTSSIFVDVEHTKPVSAKPSTEETESFDKVASEIEGEKFMRTPDIVLVASAEVNSTTASSVVPVEGSVTSRADMTYTVQLQGPDDGIGICVGYLHREVKEPHNRQNLCVDNKETACAKGPINAINTPGGFDSFLDLWETAREFYFDVHYNKRLEVNAVAPFEIHGMAICWESSPVYYVNLPKDLLWSDKRRDDYSSLGTSGDKGTFSPHEHWLEIVGERWNRIGKMLGKRNVRKFTWNLKVQVQVLKIPAVSVKKFGLDLAGKNLGIELIDNSYSLLSPVHIKDGIDMCIVAWILWPDEERSSNPNLEKVIRRIILTSLGVISSMCSVFLKQMEFLIFTMLKIMAK